MALEEFKREFINPRPKLSNGCTKCGQHQRNPHKTGLCAKCREAICPSCDKPFVARIIGQKMCAYCQRIKNYEPRLLSYA